MLPTLHLLGLPAALLRTVVPPTPSRPPLPWNAPWPGPASLKPGQEANTSLSVRTWRTENSKLATELVHTDAVVQAVAEAEAVGCLGGVALATAYLAKAGEVAKQRAVEAGLRLAAICESSSGDQ